jgi:precorrin-2 dehydrogenase/sirohydrochlorin ferrochelatase
VVDRSPVIAAIGTGGAAPVLATLLRNSLEARWPEGLGRVATLSGELQKTVRETLPDPAARRAWWRRMLKGPAARAAEAGDMDEARRLALAALDAPRDPGRVQLLPIPSEPERLTLAALRALAAADRIVADPKPAEPVLGYARRDAKREGAATPDQLAAWAAAGETVLVLTVEGPAALAAALASLGVAAETLPVA